MNNVQVWSALLEKAPPGSVLMGGAIVDSLVGVEPKDYDICHTRKLGWDIPEGWKYIPPKDMEARAAEYDIENKEGGNPIKEVNDFDVEVNDKVRRVQLIHLDYDDPRKHFKNFDHSLTLAWFNKNGVFIHRKVFESIDNKTITLLNNKNPDKSLIRAKRKAEKYGGEWQFKGWE